MMSHVNLMTFLNFWGKHKTKLLTFTSVIRGLTCVKLRRAAESVTPCRPVDGRHTHSGQRRDVGQSRRARVCRQVEGGALASDGVLLLFPGEPVATSRPGVTGLPVHLHCITAHCGQLQVCQGWSHCGQKQGIRSSDQE